MVAGRQHVYAAGESRSQRVRSRGRDRRCDPPFRSSFAKRSEHLMNPVAASRLTVVEDDDLPPPSTVDAVASIARRELAPLAADIDSGALYPAEVLRRLGDAAAWASHLTRNGAADLRCAIQSMAASG